MVISEKVMVEAMMVAARIHRSCPRVMAGAVSARSLRALSMIRRDPTGRSGEAIAGTGRPLAAAGRRRMSGGRRLRATSEGDIPGGRPRGDIPGGRVPIIARQR